MCGKLPHVETLSNPDNYSLINCDTEGQRKSLHSYHMKLYKLEKKEECYFWKIELQDNKLIVGTSLESRKTVKPTLID